MFERKRIALPYKVRGKDYGIPISSLAELKDNPRVVALSDFDLIQSLKDAFYTTTVYVLAKHETIVQRLKNREDSEEQRQKSIDSVPLHLVQYSENKNLFDYEITNGKDLAKAQERLARIVKKEASDIKYELEFLLPSLSYETWEADGELRGEPGTKASPLSRKAIEAALSELSNSTFGVGQSLDAPIVYMYKGVSIYFSSKRDRERDSVSFGEIGFYGKHAIIKEAVGKIVERFPELMEGDYSHNRERLERL